MKNLMLILERYVDTDGQKLRIGGVVTRDVAHYHGVPHGAVQVAVVAIKQDTPHILLHKRSQWKKTSPDTWDICGGHIDAPHELASDVSSWNNHTLIAQLFRETAVREANEEVEIIRKPGFKFQEQHVICFGGLGVFECGLSNPTAQNREHSAFYLAFVPKTIVTLTGNDKAEDVFRITDTIDVAGGQKEEVALELRLVTLSDLAQDFRQNEKDYADGIGRVLSRLACEPGTTNALNQQLVEFYR